MAIHDYVIANGTGAAVRGDLNDALAAIVSQNSSATAPTTTYAYMLWADTTAGILKQRNGANNAWIELIRLDGAFDSKTFNGNVTLNAQGDVRFADSDSSNWVAFQAPATIASNITWTLPATDGTADQAFATNGSGTLGWVSFLKSSGGALTGDLTLNAQSDLRFADADSSNWVAFQAPATVASNITWTLPATDGTSGQSLQTNGSGTLSWASASVTIANRSDVNGVHTTGSVTSGTTSLTVASATGIVAGMVVTGEGITPGTTVSSIASTTVTLSANAGATLSSDPVGFYDNTKALSPGSVGGQLCRAWVNFDGTGTVAIRASYNVSSITDNGVGDYTVNFTTALADANYAVSGHTRADAAGGAVTLTAAVGSTTWQQSGSVRISAFSTAGGLVDTQYVSVAIFR